MSPEGTGVSQHLHIHHIWAGCHHCWGPSYDCKNKICSLSRLWCDTQCINRRYVLFILCSERLSSAVTTTTNMNNHYQHHRHTDEAVTAAEGMDQLLQSLHTLISDSKNPWIQIYLLRNLCKIYGFNIIHQLGDKFKWAIPSHGSFTDQVTFAPVNVFMFMRN